MKSIFFTFLAVIVFSLLSTAQSFRYSEEVGKVYETDQVNLVANIGGFHHVPCFPLNKQPKIFIFNAQLKKHDVVKLGEKVKENTDIRIIPFSDHYLLYLHTLNSPVHSLWRIEADGKQTSLSESLMQVIGEQLSRSTATLQLLKQKDKLFLIAHSYYDSLQQVVSKIVQLDANLKVVNAKAAMFPFHGVGETLQQVDYLDRNLYVLKTVRNSGDGNLLHLFRIDLETGDITEKIFNSGSSVFFNPAFRYAAADSTLLVHAVVRTAAGPGRSQMALFMCRLNQRMEEASPVRTLRLGLGGVTQEEYCWVDGRQPEWLEAKVYLRPPLFIQQRMLRPYATGGFSFQRYESGAFNTPAFRQPSMHVRLRLLSGQFQPLKDSVMTGANEKAEFLPFGNATFRLRNKAYVLLLQQYPRNNKALLLVSATSGVGLETTELPVYSKYDYRISALQPLPAENAVLVPFLHKRQLGLVKITMAEGGGIP